MNLFAPLNRLYPEGSRQGECGTFAHRLANFPSLGNSLYEKEAVVRRYGITARKLNGFQQGDIVVTRESLSTGHVAMVNDTINGLLQLTESNFHLDRRVHHTRVLSPQSSVIYGVIRAPLLFRPMQVKLQNLNGEIRLVLQAADENQLNVMCAVLGLDPHHIDEVVHL